MQLTPDGLITLERTIQLKPYKPRSFMEREYLTDQELIANVGKTMLLDIELYPNYFLCSFKLHGTNKFLVLEVPFNTRLLAWIMNNYRTIGFNSINYDLLILWLAYSDQTIERLKDASNDIILTGLRGYELKRKYGFFTFKTNHIDLIQVTPLKGSLKLYGARLHSPRIQDLPFPDTQCLNNEEKLIVKHYNFNDLDVTEQIFDFCKERIELRENMGNEYNEDLRSKSDAQIAEVVLVKEVTKINGKEPKKVEIEDGTTYRYSVPSYLQYKTDVLKDLLNKVKSAKFIVNGWGKIDLPKELEVSVKIGNNSYRLGIGGLHSEEKTVSYVATKDKKLKDRDVTSYYPRLVTTLGLYPPAMGPAFLVAYETIIQSRIRAKEAKRKTEANGKKIVVNGAGGKFSDPYSLLHGPDLTIQMTVTGQLDLLLFIEALTLCGLDVVSANTDGVVTLVPVDKEDDYNKCYQWWEAVTGFATEETEYSSYYGRDVNSYFAVKLGAKTKADVKIKGPWSEVGSQSGTQLDTNPTSQICTDAICELLVNNTSIEQTIKECKDFTRFVTVRQAKAPGAHKNGEYLGKVVRFYYAKGELGAIHTVQTNNKVAGTDGAKPCMDLPASFPDDINYDWYEARCREILEEIGYIKKAKQVEFF